MSSYERENNYEFFKLDCLLTINYIISIFNLSFLISIIMKFWSQCEGVCLGFFSVSLYEHSTCRACLGLIINDNNTGCNE